MNALGVHLLVELQKCNPEILKNHEKIKEIMVTAAKEAEATIVGTSWNEFSPFGFSGVVVIAESHLTIHTWPEHAYAAVDVFTCGDTLHPEKAVEYLVKKFECKNPSVVEVKRGILSYKNEKLLHKVTEASQVTTSA